MAQADSLNIFISQGSEKGMEAKHILQSKLKKNSRSLK